MSDPRDVVVADPDPRERARVQELLRVPAEELQLSLEVPRPATVRWPWAADRAA